MLGRPACKVKSKMIQELKEAEAEAETSEKLQKAMKKVTEKNWTKK